MIFVSREIRHRGMGMTKMRVVEALIEISEFRAEPPIANACLFIKKASCSGER